jgi:hypothetical protein
MQPLDEHQGSRVEPGDNPRTPGWRRLLWPPDLIAGILLLAAFFDWISGNAVHALFLGCVGIILGRETLQRRRAARVPLDEDPAIAEADDPSEGGIGGTLLVGGDGRVTVDESAERSHAGVAGARYRVALFALGGIVYAVVVASFARYSWPATLAVASLGAAVVAAGWEGPRESRSARARLPRRGAIAWAAVLIAGALWELSALLLQPTLTTDSLTHPTISVLTDPLLATYAGRAVVLLLWLAAGWYLMQRGDE